MPYTATLSLATSFNGSGYNCNTSVTAEQGWNVSFTLGPAKAGTLTTRTDANTGTLTMADAGHGITTGARLDLYWDGGLRYGITVGSVSGVTVPIDLGGGDDLPVVDTAITAMVPEAGTASITGANVVLLVAGSNCTGASSQVVYTQSDDTLIAAYEIAADLQATPPWFDGSGFTNPVTGVTLGKVYMSHGDSTASVSWTVRSSVGYNN